MKQFKKLLGEEFRRIFSNDVIMAIFFGAPIAYGLLFGFVYKQAKVLDLPIMIVDQDISPISDKIIDALGDSETFQISDIRSSLGNIASEMPSKEYAAVITIPAGFEADLLQKRYPELRIDLNMANILNANFTSKSIQTILGTINAGIEIESLKKQGMPPNKALHSYEPFKISFNKLYNSSGNYATFMLPGFLGAIMQQVIFLAMALVFARDFEDGYFSKMIKISHWSIYHVALKSIPFLLFIPLMWLIVGSFLPLFKIDLEINNVAMILLVTLLSFSAMFIGMLFSVLIPNQLKATEILMVISTPAFVLSGFTWPTLAMPNTIAKVAQYIPLTQFLEGFRKIAIYGGGIKDISKEINMLLLISAVTFTLIIFTLQLKISLKKRKELRRSIVKN